jgi:hypothetical protein
MCSFEGAQSDSGLREPPKRHERFDRNHGVFGPSLTPRKTALVFKREPQSSRRILPQGAPRGLDELCFRYHGGGVGVEYWKRCRRLDSSTQTPGHARRFPDRI